ncbi:17616_t:CDS:1, partial [Acaulospora morrowiae]
PRSQHTDAAMWKQLKALAEPLERVMTLWVKGPKANSTATGTSQLTIFTKQPVPEIQISFSQVSFYNSVKAQQQTGLRDFLFENFTIFKSFTPLPAPVPITFTQTPLRVCKPQRVGLITNHVFLQPAGTRNVFCNNGARNFSSAQTTMFNNGFSSGGVVLAKLGCKPFSALATKTGALWARVPDNSNPSANPSEFVGLKIEAERKLFQSKGIFDAVQKQETDEYKHNNPRVVRRTTIKKSRKNKTVAKIIDQEITEKINDQVYMSFMLSSSLFWDFNESSISMENSCSSINSIASMLSHMIRKKNVTTMNKLDLSFIENLEEHEEIHHNHMMEVISILKILQTHGVGYEIKVFDSELRVNFPRGMTILEVQDLLESLGIDLESPHFDLEVIQFGGNIALSPPSDEIDVHLPEPSHNLHFYDTADSFLYVRDSHPSTLSISPASPSYIPSAPPSPCMAPWKPMQQSTRHGQEYFNGIEEFINRVENFSDRSAGFGREKENSEYDDSEIGESYIEL